MGALSDLLFGQYRGAFGTGSPQEEMSKPNPLANILLGATNAVATLPQRAIQNSQYSLNNGTYDPSVPMEAAMALTGGAGIMPAEFNSLRAGLTMKRLPDGTSLAIPPAPTLEDMARAAKIEAVPLSHVRGTQSKMDWSKFDSGEHPPELLKGYGDKPVAVRKENGEYLLFDGHHRAVAAINGGADNMEMHVINAKDYAPEFAGRKPAPPSMSDDDLMKELLAPTGPKEHR